MILPPDTEVMWLTRGRTSGVAEKADQAQVIENRPDASTGEGESKSVHDGAPAIVE